MAELVDAHDSKSCIFGCAGSIPAFGTEPDYREMVRFFIYLNSSNSTSIRNVFH